MRDDPTLLIEAGIGLGIIGLCSISAFYGALSQLRSRTPKDNWYEDKDGQATPEAVATFSNKGAKSLIVVCAGVGLASQIAVAVLSALQATSDGIVLENWLATAAWALCMLQAVVLVATHSSTKAFTLGVWLSISGLVLAIVLLLQSSEVLEVALHVHPVSFAMRVVCNVATFVLMAAGILLPRRPDVQYNGRDVDRMYTNSAYSRITFRWPMSLLGIARAKKDLEVADLPRPGHSLRAADQAAAWRAFNYSGPLWKGLLWLYAGSLAAQWGLCLVSSALSYMPYLVTLQILRTMEDRQTDEAFGADTWILVVWLGLGIISQAIVESNMWWISWSHLGLPVRSQLSAIIFEKSMRRKNVKSASRSDKDKKDEEAKSAENAAAAAEPVAADSKKDSKQDKKEDEGDEEDDPTGQKSRQAVINLIGVDAKRVAEFSMFQFLFPNSAAKLIGAVWILVYLIGIIPLTAGLITWLVIIPINTYFAKKYAAAQDRLMKVRDQKLAIVNESLQGIRQIKFSSLESQWEKRILASREKELKACWDVFIGDTALYGCWVISPIALAATSLAVYAIIHNELTPSVAFVSIGVFKSLEITLAVIPELLTDCVDCWVSLKRIDKYLAGPELTKVTENNPEVAFENASIAWPVDEDTPESERFVLRNVDLTFPRGELSVISGKTGTGKSLMLAAILGEADLLAGSIYIPDGQSLIERQDHKANGANWILPDNIAFVGQIPWIENATLKDNILFGLPLDQERYDQTIIACALKKDLDMLTDGDSTELGANGINLSGGQKWRVTLARAVYSRAGILVLDDIFSAVDSHVGRHIFEHCLTGDLCTGRTRILVTHHVALCESRTKFIVELGDGAVQNSGLTSELEEEGVLQLIKSHEQSQQEIAADEEALTAVNSESPSEIGAINGGTQTNSTEADGEDDLDGGPLTKAPSKKIPAAKFVENEGKEKGAVNKKIYGIYLHDSGGWIWWSGAVIIFVSAQILVLTRSWWLRIWTGTYEESSIQTYEEHKYAHALAVQHADIHVKYPPVHASQDHPLRFYLGIYVALSVVHATVGTLRFYYMFRMSIMASRSLFEKMTHTVLRAPLRWLDTVPVGRVLNRFTADFNIIDNRIAIDMSMLINASLGVVGICVASLFVTPIIIVLAVFLLGWCLYYADRYLDGARPVKRLESVAKSPIFELFGSSLTGVSTIRGFDKSQDYIKRMNEKLDDYSMTTWYLWLFNRWMGLRMSMVGSLFSTFVAVLILVVPNMDAALAGFTMSFSLDFSSAILWAIRAYANIELDLNAAERVIEYAELTTESQDGEKPPAAWPTEGKLEVKDLVVGYAPELPPVLKGLSFSVRQNERVGVVGRTGAGKSSLTLALFRFLEPRDGSIFIDGLDISKVSLHELRSRIAIIPQDPVLFSGTVRTNLDPFDDHNDSELRDSLQRVHLVSENESDSPTPTGAQAGASVELAAGATPTNPKNVNIFKKLTSPISEGGLNLSQGQRQLLCLARAIVSRPKIMVLDEATSAVDMTTDTLIQRSIREEFGGSTLIVIAHRLSTIADFDRILVLNDGMVAEFGTPKELWEKNDSVFRGMCNESGEREKLKEIIFASSKGEGSGSSSA